MNIKPRQVPFFLYWRVENVQFWINSIGILVDWAVHCILNFPRFHKTVNSLELWKYISEKSSPKGSFSRNKRKSEFSELSWHTPYLKAMAIFCHCSFPTFFLSFSSPFSRFFYSCYLLHFTSFRAVAKSWVLTKYKIKTAHWSQRRMRPKLNKTE